ncbi:peptidoglycan DD-metalloendopeptidase family protein [Zhaonella formicivorans]|jgi:murein DD-endopeptidase MepM/ murein hydrolase activator NlpD|uniref:peptidoglycan DD-metalloendopeptidase family protein n=1 Tax=Zhaonella formicivorans TaxID=2528593 RepID=UPI001D11BD2D|nr:M23 family metallopeptidase [Zhaonella formicivorans]
MNFSWRKPRVFYTLILCASLLAGFGPPAEAVGLEVFDLWQIRVPYGQNLEQAVKPQPSIQLYHVKKGDTLWSIARLYNVDLKAIMTANNLRRPEQLQAGSDIIIPRGPAFTPATASPEIKLASRGFFSLDWPLFGTITSGFGWRKKEFHHGLDIAAKKGTSIKAIDAGRVIFSGWKNSVYGYTVIIDHGGDIKAVYAHNSKNLVKTGEWVKAGQTIGLVGSTGRTTGPHLHLEIHLKDQPVNPKRYLTKR